MHARVFSSLAFCVGTASKFAAPARFCLSIDQLRWTLKACALLFASPLNHLILNGNSSTCNSLSIAATEPDCTIRVHALTINRAIVVHFCWSVARIYRGITRDPPIMLIILPIMLCCTAQKFTLYA